jgi:hypothetical protein
MAEPSEHESETERIARSFRPQWRPVAITVGANLLLTSLLLGVPYWRGHEIALRQRQAFAQLAQCVFGGHLPTSPGLSLPSGDRDHYADNVLYAPEDWPLSCRRPLQALAPPDVIFLWPSVKRAGADLRAVVRLVDQELVLLHQARGLGSARVPSRPLAAIAKLQGALTLMAQAAGTDEDLDNDVLRFEPSSALATPARLPLFAAPGAVLHLTAAGGVLEALAIDARGVSWLRLDGGKIDRERVKRTGLLRSMLHTGNEPFMVWATPEARCRERADHCAFRATGVAAYARGAGALPSPTWLAGHPTTRPDRAMQVGPNGRVDMLARRAPDGGIVLRRFLLPATVAVPGAPPLNAESTTSILESTHVSDSHLVPNELNVVAYAEANGGTVNAALVWADHARAPVVLDPVPGDDPFISACGSADTHYVVYGSLTAHRIARIDATGVGYTTEVLVRRMSRAFSEDNPALDQLRLLCAAAAAQLLVLDVNATLWLTTCSRDAACAPAIRIAEQVSTFDAIGLEKHTVIAFSGAGSASAIRILRVSSDGKASGPAVVPAACWNPSEGMCGLPSLAQEGQRLLLAARENSDLLVLESNDAGAHFTTLSGLKMRDAFDPVSHDPLEQHRVRKGLH